jgi:hypothetical protein
MNALFTSALLPLLYSRCPNDKRPARTSVTSTPATSDLPHESERLARVSHWPLFFPANPRIRFAHRAPATGHLLPMHASAAWRPITPTSTDVASLTAVATSPIHEAYERTHLPFGQLTAVRDTVNTLTNDPSTELVPARQRRQCMRGDVVRPGVKRLS